MMTFTNLCRVLVLAVSLLLISFDTTSAQSNRDQSNVGIRRGSSSAPSNLRQLKDQISFSSDDGEFVRGDEEYPCIVKIKYTYEMENSLGSRAHSSYVLLTWPIDFNGKSIILTPQIYQEILFFRLEIDFSEDTDVQVLDGALSGKGGNKVLALSPHSDAKFSSHGVYIRNAKMETTGQGSVVSNSSGKRFFKIVVQSRDTYIRVPYSTSDFENWGDYKRAVKSRLESSPVLDAVVAFPAQDLRCHQPATERAENADEVRDVPYSAGRTSNIDRGNGYNGNLGGQHADGPDDEYSSYHGSNSKARYDYYPNDHLSNYQDSKHYHFDGEQYVADGQ